jgi:hypothetical protein
MTDMDLDRRCYHLITTHQNDQGNPLVVIVKENDDGYFPTGLDFGPEEQAQRLVRNMNHELGLTDEDVATIIGNSMFLARRHGAMKG